MLRSSQKELRHDPIQYFSRAANKLHNLWLAWTYPFAALGKGAWIHRSCELPRPMAKYISIGNNVAIGENVWINIPEPPDHDDPIIILEDGCEIGRGATISAKNRIHLERNVLFAPSVFLTDHNHAFEDITRPIQLQGTTEGGTLRIETGCWVGFGAAIVGGHGQVVIGRNSVVGANSVVTRSVPPYTVVAGSPARAIKHYDRSKETWVRSAAASRD
jgi:acetyltransferase-like isoleucine patch superfamily enzyme